MVLERYQWVFAEASLRGKSLNAFMPACSPCPTSHFALYCYVPQRDSSLNTALTMPLSLSPPRFNRTPTGVPSMSAFSPPGTQYDTPTRTRSRTVTESSTDPAVIIADLHAKLDHVTLDNQALMRENTDLRQTLGGRNALVAALENELAREREIAAQAERKVRELKMEKAGKENKVESKEEIKKEGFIGKLWHRLRKGGD
ncbi:hypothetical protein P153DRAFT_391440 [Dothidotthia symphoricarpi CBS 119687]|uniref:Uncharacterized protein n=1 Tax=Dothidotthia symphoricarpi CBS 119687 TaxID=1392245 RepID=A0A6A5ZVJ0_9PLEO|nr:uncharacterized protein P153DRAFT_391440 [Dothidotthia symphoricarpi CBS 119687]KAF2123600.1 hypothetical protein P153DRAFT_391440 [Dothidotthia symphoricarpi CBS 119687]